MFVHVPFTLLCPRCEIDGASPSAGGAMASSRAKTDAKCAGVHVPAAQAVDISTTVRGRWLRMRSRAAADLRKQGAAAGQRSSRLVHATARAFTWLQGLAPAPPPGRGGRPEPLPGPPACPGPAAASTVTLAVPAEEPMSTRAISASSMRYGLEQAVCLVRSGRANWAATSKIRSLAPFMACGLLRPCAPYSGSPGA